MATVSPTITSLTNWTGPEVAGYVFSMAHTCSGGNYLVAGFNALSDTTIVSVTYGETAMSLIMKAMDRRINMWGLLNPAAGFNNLIITCTGVATGINLTAASYANVNPLNPVGSPNWAFNQTTGTCSVTVSGTISSDVVVGAAMEQSDDLWTPTGVGQIKRVDSQTGVGGDWVTYMDLPGSTVGGSTTWSATTNTGNMAIVVPLHGIVEHMPFPNKLRPSVFSPGWAR